MENQVGGWRTYPIFISSTFKDMDAERDMIQKIIIPKLRETLKPRRVDLKVIDLRWGVDSSIADAEARESAILKVCLNTIKNNRPFFIGLLGDRYGWIPPASRWNSVYESLSGDEKAMIASGRGKSVTELEILFGALGNADEILSRSLFYYRKQESYDGMPASLNEIYREEAGLEAAEKRRLLKELKENIMRVCDENNYPNAVREYSLVWNDGGNGEKRGFADVDFCGQMYAHLLQEINEEIEEAGKEGEYDWYESEENALNDFVYSQTKHFVGREELLGELAEGLNAGEGQTLLTGLSGSGKSSLFCMLYRRLKQENRPRRIILAHSAGITPASFDAENMLQRWIRTVCDELDYPEQADVENRDTATAYKEKFGEVTALAEERGYKVIILVDAIDRFSRGIFSEYLQWLPQDVAFLGTALPGATEKPLTIHPGLRVRNIDAFKRSEAEDMLSGIGASLGKQIPRGVVGKILEKKGGGGIYAHASPLWLQLVGNVLFGLDADDFAEIRGREEFHEHEKIEGFLMELAESFPAAPGDVFVEILKRASGDYGAGLTRKSMEYISVSRNGLREKDLASLLGTDWNELDFALLRRWLGPLVVEDRNNRQWKLGHNLLSRTVSEGLRERERGLHDNLGTYLLSLPADDPLRRSEAMYHLVKADRLRDGAHFYAAARKNSEIEESNRALMDFYNEDKSILSWLIEGTSSFEDESLLCTYAQRLTLLFFKKKAFGNYRDYMFLCRGLFGHIDYKSFGVENKRNVGIMCQDIAFWCSARKDTDNLMYFSNIFLDCYEEVLKHHPDDEVAKNTYVIALSNLGDSYLGMGDTQKAMEYYKKMLE